MVAGSLVLNVAQQPLLQILQRSSLSVSPPGAPRTTGETALYMPIATTACKFYVHYDTAWWRTLNLNSGSYSSSAPNTLSLPLNGRYHDGHARCRSDGSCYGFLLVVYSMSAGQCSFFEEFQLADDPPVTVFRCASPPPSCPRAR